VFGGALTARASKATMALDKLVAKAVSRPDFRDGGRAGRFSSWLT